MIVLALITLVFGIFKVLLYLVPNIPAMPAAFTDPLNFLAGFIGGGVGVVNYILTPPLFFALTVVAIALFTFDYLWAVFWWTLRKIPFVSSNIRK